MKTAILFKPLFYFLSREISIEEKEEILEEKKAVMKQILESSFDLKSIRFGEDSSNFFYIGNLSNQPYITEGAKYVQITCCKNIMCSWVNLEYDSYVGMELKIKLSTIHFEDTLEKSLKIIKEMVKLKS